MSIQKRTTRAGKPRWVARYRDPTGKEHSRTFTTQREAKAYLSEQTRAIRRSEWIDEKAAPTLAEMWTRWEQVAVSPGTKRTRERVRQNLGELENLPVTKITPEHLRTWLSHLRTGRPWVEGCKGLAINTQTSFWTQLSGCLRMAVEDGHLLVSPTSKVKSPSGVFATDTSKLPTIEQVKEAIETADSTGRDTLATMIILAASTGMRSSEVAGLRWRNVDTKAKVVHVVEQAASMHDKSEHIGESRWAPLKTKQSRRLIPLSNATIKRLAEHRLKHPSDPNEPMFLTPGGKMFRSDGISAAMRALGLRFHDLRHLYASHLIRQGRGVKAVQEMLGHASAATTLNTYTHLWSDEWDLVREAAGDLVRDLSGDGRSNTEKRPPQHGKTRRRGENLS